MSTTRDAAGQALLSATLALLSQVEAHGIQTIGVRELVAGAQRELTEGDSAKGVQLLAQADTLLRFELQKFRSAQKAIRETERALEAVAKTGVDVSGFLEALGKARAAFNQSDYRRAADLARRVHSDIESMQ